MSQPNLPSSPQPTYDNNVKIRTAVNRLTELLEWLYPEPSPDIFTVRDYRNRYPFTRLGALATGDIDRYQRINRAIGHHVQIGLCEYHIGLIYLHEGDFRGAVQQFDQARHQWVFVNQSAAIALTHLGRTVALRLGHHFESAMMSAGKVAVWLDRARLGEPVPQGGRFFEKVLSYVAELQVELRQLMSPPPETAVNGTTDIANGQPPGPPTSAMGAATPASPGPDLTTDAATRADDEIETGATARPPIVNLDRTAVTALPIPEHLLVDDRYGWYLVESRPESDFLPEVKTGDWLLVDLEPGITEDLHDTEQPILIVKKENIGGTIRVRPLDPKDRFQRIYLVTLADTPTGAFRVDEATGTVSFSHQMPEIGVARQEILGFVVGFWRPMREVLPVDQP
ncbi:MAG: hypothetical protein IT327_19245 [Anaerolineae bacterium]|nr:hypothetical protein [Anaerolineae bacterium]